MTDDQKPDEDAIAAGVNGAPQGRCDTTLTERFAYPGCKCGTYEGNLGPCKTFETGASDRCVYCDHGRECHDAILSAAEKSC
jgi:hypothetical protein